MPAGGEVLATEEPYVRASIIVPMDFVGTMMDLNQDRRGDFQHMEYLSRSASSWSTTCRWPR